MRCCRECFFVFLFLLFLSGRVSFEEMVQLICPSRGTATTPTNQANLGDTSGPSNIMGWSRYAQDVADTICFLLSEESGDHGMVLEVDGGANA